MKKHILFILLLTSGFASAQNKKKNPVQKEPVAVVLTKTEDLVAEIIKNNLYTFRLDGKSKKDTLLLKNLTGTPTPTDCTIKKFKVKDTPMYLITWKEQASMQTTLKKEEVTNTCNQIWDPKTKTKVFENEQKSTTIKEQVFLDKLKTASETQQRMRNEGYVFTLLPSGEFTLRNKMAESKYSYNPLTAKFEVPVNAVTPKSTGPVKKKKK